MLLISRFHYKGQDSGLSLFLIQGSSCWVYWLMSRCESSGVEG